MGSLINGVIPKGGGVCFISKATKRGIHCNNRGIMQYQIHNRGIAKINKFFYNINLYGFYLFS